MKRIYCISSFYWLHKKLEKIVNNQSSENFHRMHKMLRLEVGWAARAGQVCVAKLLLHPRLAVNSDNLIHAIAYSHTQEN